MKTVIVLLWSAVSASALVIPQPLPEEARGAEQWVAYGEGLAAFDETERLLHLVRRNDLGEWRVDASWDLDTQDDFRDAWYYRLKAAGERLILLGYTGSSDDWSGLAVGWIDGASNLRTIAVEPLLAESGLVRSRMKVRDFTVFSNGLLLLWDEINSWMYPEQNRYNRFAWIDLGHDEQAIRFIPSFPEIAQPWAGEVFCALEPRERDPAVVFGLNETFHIIRMHPGGWAIEASLPMPERFTSANDLCMPDATGNGFLASRWNIINRSTPAWVYKITDGGWTGPEQLDTGDLEGKPVPLAPGLVAVPYVGMDLLEHVNGEWRISQRPGNVPFEGSGLGEFVGNMEVLHMVRIAEKAEVLTWSLPEMVPFASPWFPDLPVVDGYQEIPWFGWLETRPSLDERGTWAWHFGSGWIWLRARNPENLPVWDPALGDLFYSARSFDRERGGHVWSYPIGEYIYLTGFPGSGPRWYHVPSRNEWLAAVVAPRELPAEAVQGVGGEELPTLTILPDGRIELRETIEFEGQQVLLIAVGKSTYWTDLVFRSEATLNMEFNTINVYLRGNLAGSVSVSVSQLWEEDRIPFPARIEARLSFHGEDRGRYAFTTILNSGQTEGPFEGAFGN